MYNRQPDIAGHFYKCSRCGGEFAGQGIHTVCCPYCAMLCDEPSCRIAEDEVSE